MSSVSPESLRANTSHFSQGKATILDALNHHELVTSEILGVVVHNVRHSDEGEFFDSPISIDLFDQRTLASMRIVRRLNRSVLTERDIPIAELTRFGRYVIQRAVLLNDGIQDGQIPQVDAQQLRILLS